MCVSSAYRWYSKPYFLVRSPSGVIYAVKSNGPRTDPWGTPNGTAVGDELSLPIRTNCFLLAKYDLSHSSAATVTPNLCLSLLNRMPWSIVSNAAVKSSSTSTTTQPLSTADKMSLWTLNKAVSVEWFFRYADYICSCKLFSRMWEVSCCATTRSITFETNSRFCTGR